MPVAPVICIPVPLRLVMERSARLTDTDPPLITIEVPGALLTDEAPSTVKLPDMLARLIPVVPPLVAMLSRVTASTPFTTSTPPPVLWIARVSMTAVATLEPTIAVPLVLPTSRPLIVLFCARVIPSPAACVRVGRLGNAGLVVKSLWAGGNMPSLANSASRSTPWPNSKWLFWRTIPST